MAFTVTKRQEFTNPTDSAALSNFSTDSVTNTANALHLVFYGVIDSSAASPALVTPTGTGAPTYTLVVKDGESDNWYYDSFGLYACAAGCWKATIGSSPSALVLGPIDPWTGGNVGGGWLGSCDITGHDTGSPIVQSAVLGSSLPASGDQSGTVVLGAAPSNGNCLLVFIYASSDTVDASGIPSSPTAGSGKTMTGNLHTGHINSRFDYRICDGTESATITCPDLGNNPGNYVMVAVEVKLASAVQPKLYVPLIRRPHLGKMTGRA